MGLISEDLVYHKVIIPQSITMTIYAISIFGTSMSLPITLIIFKYSTKIQVSDSGRILQKKINFLFA